MVVTPNKVLYEGKAKILYHSLEPTTLIQYFKDDATADNAKKHAIIESKGICLGAELLYLIFLYFKDLSPPSEGAHSKQ